MNTVSQLKKELEKAVLRGQIEKAEELSDKLFHLQGGTDTDTVIPDGFAEKIKERYLQKSGGQKTMNAKKIISIVAIAAVTATLGITALATRWYGLRDMVFKDNKNNVVTKDNAIPASSSDVDTESTPDGIEEALIALQGYPDSNEYKANAEWNLFCAGYDTDHKYLNEIGNGSNEYTEKYPMYLVYTKDMADKLEEIVKKYKLTLHTSMEFVYSAEELATHANTGDFIGQANTVLGGYVYNDGTFQYDGEAVLKNSKQISYQFGNYIKGTFSATYLNIGNADAYTEWAYKTKSGVQVSLALSENKALVIADLENSYAIINVLSDNVKPEELQEFADTFDYTKL